MAEIFSEHKYTYKMPCYFPTIGEYAALLENAGFSVRYAVLFDRMTELKGENGLKDWINMFVKTPFTVIENEDEKRMIIDKTVDRLKGILYRDGKWYADYVRLRMKAIRFNSHNINSVRRAGKRVYLIKRRTKTERKMKSIIKN